MTTDNGDGNAARQVTQWAMPPEFLAQKQSASLKDKENRGVGDKAHDKAVMHITANENRSAGAGGLHEQVGGKRLRDSGDVCGSGEGSAARTMETRTLQLAQKRQCGSGEAGASVIEPGAGRRSDVVACRPAVAASAAEAVTAGRGDDTAPAGRDARLECRGAIAPAGEATRVAAASAAASPPQCRRDKASALAQTRGVDAMAHSVGGSGEGVGSAKDGREGQGVTTLKPPEPDPVANMAAVAAVGLAGALVEKELPRTRPQLAPGSIRDAGAGGAGAGEAVAGGLDVPAVRAVTASSHASGLALGDRILQQCADKRHRWQLAQSGQQAAATADLRLHQMRHFERPFSQSDALSELDVVTL